MVKGRDLIVIADHLAISMKKQNPRPFVMSHVKATGDGGPSHNSHGEVESIFRAGSKVLAGIKNELQ
jgi:hypothetical protein